MWKPLSRLIILLRMCRQVAGINDFLNIAPVYIVDETYTVSWSNVTGVLDELNLYSFSSDQTPGFTLYHARNNTLSTL